jgi:hypothetical protein
MDPNTPFAATVLSVSDGLTVLFQPSSQGCFVKSAFRQRDKRFIRLFLGRSNGEAVQTQESMATTKAVRLLPSTKGWLQAIPNA